MQPPYDAALREAVRIRMSPPNRESVAQIARDTWITAQTIDNWRSQWRNRQLERELQKREKALTEAATVL
ncbi:MAG: hypothetical protein VKK98_10530 [Cyanobacteriota bacterium]|nr:hypothetical protein [Cyanobacteriota bacterium]